MKKYGFIYIWYDRKRKMYYIGSHWGKIEDSYICSSNRMRDAHRRRPQDFRRRIIEKTTIREALYDIEQKWLNLISNTELGKKYYNLTKKKTGCWAHNENSRKTVGEKIGNALKGKTKSPETVAKMKANHKGRTGQKWSAETREKMKNRVPWNKGMKGYLAGEKHYKIKRKLYNETRKDSGLHNP
jgi:hypothetical protein